MACVFVGFRKVTEGSKSNYADLNRRALENVKILSSSTHLKYTPPETVDSLDSQLPKKVD
jgi:hypothetical protein